MERLRQVGKILVYFFIVCIIFLISTDYQNIDLENYELLLIFNVLFTGLIPIFVASIAIRTYLNNNLINALIFGCGMLIFGFGSISAGIGAVRHQDVNVLVTVYNLCALLSSGCLLYSTLHDEKINQGFKTKKIHSIK